MDQSTVVPMRFYANWDVDRTSASAIPRTLCMKFTRLNLTKPLTSENVFMIAVKLKGYRRILRSNDINIVSQSKLDYCLDISFTIQYCHFIKRKSNVLEIFIQRRKKYKNRQIPGFKTIAFGNMSLNEILQQGGSREVSIWDTASLKLLSVQDFHAGTIFISNCYSHVMDSGDQDSSKWIKSSGKYTNILSEEEVDDDSSQDDSDFDDFEQNQSHQNNRIKRSRKKIKQKNIKQKVIALLKKFRVSEEEGNTSNVTGTRSSRVLPPTELELQEIFEELDNISDSGPELEPDKMSIVSNPRPGLRPFFGSKTDILPAIKDHAQSDDSIPYSDEQDQESSEETHKESCFWVEKVPFELGNLSLHSSSFPLCTVSTTEQTTQNLQNIKTKIKHSLTINSINSMYGSENRQSSARNTSFFNKKSDNSLFLEMMTQFDTMSDNTSVVPYNIWLTSSTDFPWISKVDSSKLDNSYLFNCPCVADVRTAIYTIISRIQKFCNSNSIAPSTTRIGILGGDKLISQVLRIYVDLLRNKACQDWRDYLRFSVITLPNTAVGRYIGQQSFLEGYLESLWSNTLSRLSTVFGNENACQNDYNDFDDCLSKITVGNSTDQQRLLNLSIGEIMLQLETKDSLTTDNSMYVVVEGDSSQVFVPFLAELYLGNSVECSNYTLFKSSFDDCGSSPLLVSAPLPAQTNLSLSNSQITFPLFSGTTGNLSPPISPYTQKNVDIKELQVEYWTYGLGSSLFNQNSSQNQEFYPLLKQQSLGAVALGSIISSNINNKVSMKINVRNLYVTKEPATNSLSILFVKEKKKDKVLQKLGRKTKQKMSDCNLQSRFVTNVTRMICSSNKNSLVNVTIDGILWRRIRYFQISCQWHTHVKLFPMSFPVN